MAMLPCPDCRKIISENAERCPKCGRTITPDDVNKWREESEKSKKKSKKIGIFLAILIIGSAIISIFTPTKQKDIAYGELLSVTDARDVNGSVSVRVKIDSNLTNKMTIEQNYHNAVDLITNRGYNNCELRYFAVMDKTDGSEGKIMSFTVPSSVVDKIDSGKIVAIQLPDYVTDLWIHSQFQ